MDMTGWLQGQVFLQTVDEKEVEAVSAHLNARGLPSQVLTLSERMVLDEQDPTAGVSSDRFSIAIQLAGFPQVLGPVLNDQSKLFQHLSEAYLRNVLTVGGRYVCGNPKSVMPVWANTNGGPLNYVQIDDLKFICR